MEHFRKLLCFAKYQRSKNKSSKARAVQSPAGDYVLCLADHHRSSPHEIPPSANSGGAPEEDVGHCLPTYYKAHVNLDNHGPSANSGGAPEEDVGRGLRFKDQVRECRSLPSYKDQACSVVAALPIENIPASTPPVRLRTPSLRPDDETVSSSDNEVNRLSFFLRCINRDCGLHLIKEEQLLDYQNAHNLPIREQNAIVELAHAFFDDSPVVGRLVFLCSSQDAPIPPGSDYVFYKSGDVPSDLAEAAGDLEFSAFGYCTRATKIMVCRESYWREIFDFRNLVARTNNGGGNASIDSVSWALDEAKLVHCFHCKGVAEEACTCAHGCPVKVQNKCFVEHTGTFCEGCETNVPIRGLRYECQHCEDTNLCRQCYDDGKHDLSHSFACILRGGSEPAILWPRSS